ncbi:hypothetical protein ACC754_39100, partial [Rhizobium johnstonii]
LVFFEIEEVEAVVDRGVVALGQHQLDLLIETVGADEFGTGFGCELAEVAGQRLGGLLTLQVGITETRKQKYDFSEPYIASKAVLIARDGD